MGREDDGRMPAEDPAGVRARTPVTPIYRRLPRGPHRLDPREIAVHQRARIHGAMVEAVAREGYEGVTVRKVIGLAGVSRRSFYEQFANRHDCFLRTVEVIAARELTRTTDECRSARSTPAAIRAGAGVLTRAAVESPGAAALVLEDSLSAGDTGAAALGRALSDAERMLGRALARGGSAAPPAGVLRALTGAVAGVLAANLSESGAGREQRTAGAISAIVLAHRLSTHGPEGAELVRRLGTRMRRAALAAAERGGPPEARVGSASAAGREQELLLTSAARLAARQPVSRLSAVEIADGASLSIDVFFAHFADREACMLAAVELFCARLIALAERAHAVAGGWSGAVRLAFARVLDHLAASPVEARMLALIAHRVDEPTRRRIRELDRQLGGALRGAAPRRAPSAAAFAGALWHSVRQAQLEGRTRLLPALSDHLSYALLAPALGAHAAIESLAVAA